MKKSRSQQSECGHPLRKHHARGMCGSCYNRYSVNRTPELRARFLARQRLKPDRRTKEDRYKDHLLSRYGLTPETYDAMLLKQGNKCLICQLPWSKGKLYVDHDHETGRVRALLCPSCNTFVGCIEKDPNKIWRALALLERELLNEK